MTSSLSAADRVVLLMALVPYLLDHGEVSVSDLASHFGVTVKDMRSLVSFLGTAGVPGETLTYQHEDLFDIDWTALEEHDMVKLVAAVAIDDTPRFSATEAAALQAGLHVLEGALSPKLAGVAHSAAVKLTVGTTAQTGSEPFTIADTGTNPVIERIWGALNTGQRLSFTYRSREGAESQRTVDPHSLFQAHETWYLRGYCHAREASRVFRVDAMTQIIPRNEPIDPALKAGEMIGTDGSVWEYGAAVDVRVRNGAQHHLEGWHAEHIESDDESWVRYRVGLAREERAIDLVALAPGSIVVDSPESARVLVRDWAERLLQGSSPAPGDETSSDRLTE